MLTTEGDGVPRAAARAADAIRRDELIEIAAAQLLSGPFDFLIGPRPGEAEHV